MLTNSLEGDLNSSSESDTLQVAQSRLILSNSSFLIIIIFLRFLLCNWLLAEDVQDCVRCCFCLLVRPRLLLHTYFSQVWHLYILSFFYCYCCCMSESIGPRYRSAGCCFWPRLPGWLLGQQHCTAQIHRVQAANSDRIGQRAQTAGSNPWVQAATVGGELRQRDRTCKSKQQPWSRFEQRAQTGGSNATQHSVTAHRQIPLGLIGNSGHLHIHIYIYIYIYIGSSMHIYFKSYTRIRIYCTYTRLSRSSGLSQRPCITGYTLVSYIYIHMYRYSSNSSYSKTGFALAEGLRPHLVGLHHSQTRPSTCHRTRPSASWGFRPSGKSVPQICFFPLSPSQYVYMHTCLSLSLSHTLFP